MYLCLYQCCMYVCRNESIQYTLTISLIPPWGSESEPQKTHCIRPFWHEKLSEISTPTVKCLSGPPPRHWQCLDGLRISRRTYTYISCNMHTCTHTMSLCLCVCVCVCTHTCIFEIMKMQYGHMYVHYVPYIYIYIYIYTHTHTHTHTHMHASLE